MSRKIGTNLIDTRPRLVITICVTTASIVMLVAAMMCLDFVIPPGTEKRMAKPIPYPYSEGNCRTAYIASLSLNARLEQQAECEKAAWAAQNEEAQTAAATRQADDTHKQTRNAFLQTVVLFATLVPTAIGSLIGALLAANRNPRTRATAKRKSDEKPAPPSHD